MRKFFIVTAAVVTMLMGVGCGNKEEAVSSGRYAMGTVKGSVEASSDMSMDSVADSEDDIMFIPYITLDTEEKTFMFSMDSMGSDIPFGEYTIKGDVLTATTDDGKYTYKFKIVDKTHLEYMEEGSSPIGYIEEGISVNAEDGVLFGCTAEE